VYVVYVPAWECASQPIALISAGVCKVRYKPSAERPDAL
jgi:hypothetical protein